MHELLRRILKVSFCILLTASIIGCSSGGKDRDNNDDIEVLPEAVWDGPNANWDEVRWQ